MCEGMGKASWKNLYGVLPGGDHYDDAGEYTGSIDYYSTKGWGKFLVDSIGYI